MHICHDLAYEQMQGICISPIFPLLLFAMYMCPSFLPSSLNKKKKEEKELEKSHRERRLKSASPGQSAFPDMKKLPLAIECNSHQQNLLVNLAGESAPGCEASNGSRETIMLST